MVNLNSRALKRKLRRRGWVILTILLLTGILSLSIQTPSSNTEKFSIEGHWIIEAYHSDGTIYATREKDNVITTCGRNAVLSWLGVTRQGAAPGAGSGVFSTITIGTGTTPEDNADRTLQNETYRKQVGAANISDFTLSQNAIFKSGEGEGMISEAGLGDYQIEIVGLCLLNRVTFPGILKGPTDTLEVTVKITIE